MSDYSNCYYIGIPRMKKIHDQHKTVSFKSISYPCTTPDIYIMAYASFGCECLHTNTLISAF